MKDWRKGPAEIFCFRRCVTLRARTAPISSLDHPDHIFGTILDVYAAAGSTRTNDFIDNSRPCDHNRNCVDLAILPPSSLQLVPVTMD